MNWRERCGQASSEYMLILGAALVIAVLVVGLYTYVTGSAQGEQLQQSRLYWSRQRPIAITDGMATMNGKSGEGDNLVVLTLKNIGDYPVELLAIRQQPIGITGKLDATAYGVLDTVGGHRYLSPDASGMGDYRTYVASPEGTGYGYYSNKITLRPGEDVTIGFGVLASHSTSPLYSPIAYCRDSVTGDLGKYMEIGTLDIFVVEKIGNQSFVKREFGGEHLVLPCVANYTPF